MAKFDVLKALEITPEKTARLTLHNIVVNGKSPTLIGRIASASNKPYFNGKMKMGAYTPQQVRAAKAGKYNSAIIEEGRDHDRVLFPEHVIIGWEDMPNFETGETLPFSKDDCEEFFRVLPDEAFDEVVDFYANYENFTDGINIEVKAGNSPADSNGNSDIDETDFL